LKKISKVLFVDVGSHQCQEIKALKQSSIYLSILFIKRYLINLFIKDSIAPTISEFIYFLKIRKKLMKKIDFCFIAIEPNWRHFTCKIYKKLNYTFCFGLQKMDSDFKFKDLSFKSPKKNDQGASLFKTPNHSDLSDVIPVVDTDYFCKKVIQVILNTYKDDVSPKILLRLNCEGTEDDVIYSFKKMFPDKLVGILGSLDDVRKKKGANKADDLKEYLHSNSIDFCRFSSNMGSWPNALKFLENKL
jgi:hypothetical protein